MTTTQPDPLAKPSDVQLLFPFDSSETDRVTGLIAQASALLRQKIPWVDARMQTWQTDPTNPGALNPVVVAGVIATIVKRFLSNENGATSTTSSETVGPYSKSDTTAYAMRGDHTVRGELQVTDSDIDKLTPARKTRAKVGSIRLRPHMAPWPIGDMGSPAAAGIPGSNDLWLIEAGKADAPFESELPPYAEYDPHE